MKKRQQNQEPEKFLTVGMLSRRSGVPVSAIHFYERKGLIRSERDASNYRRFPRSVLRVLAVIRVGQGAGIKLEEIRERLGDAAQSSTLTASDWARISAGWESDLNARIAALSRMRDRLTGCIGCGCLSMASCPSINPGDRAAGDGPGAPGLDGRM